MASEPDSPYEDILKELISESRDRLAKLELRLHKNESALGIQGLLGVNGLLHEVEQVKYGIAKMETDLETYKRALTGIRHPTRVSSH